MKHPYAKIIFSSAIILVLLGSCKRVSSTSGPRVTPASTPTLLPTLQPSATTSVLPSLAPSPARTTAPTATRLPSVTLSPAPTSTPLPAVRVGTALPAAGEVIRAANAAGVAPLARWGSDMGIINRALPSPDGKLILLITSTGLFFYDASSLTLLHSIELAVDTGGIAFTPDSQILAVGTRVQTLFYRVADGALVKTLDTEATNLAFSPDGQKLALGRGFWDSCRDGAVDLWRVSDWSLLQTLTENIDCVKGLVFSASGKYLAASAFEVVVWEIGENSAREISRGSGCGDFDSSLSFSQDERFLAIGTAPEDNGKICLQRVATGEMFSVLDQGDTSSRGDCGVQVAFAPGGKYLATRLERTITIWQVPGWKRLRSLRESKGCSWLSGWLPDGETLLALAPDTEPQFWTTPSGPEAVLKFWAVASGMVSRSLPFRNLTSAFNTLAWSPDGATLAASYRYSRTVGLWQVKDGTLARTLDNQGTPNSLVFSPDGKTLAVGLENDRVKLWDLASGKLARVLQGELGIGLTSVSFSTDGLRFAADLYGGQASDQAETIQVWQTGDWQPALTWTTGQPALVITGLSFAPDGKTVATSTIDGQVLIWGVASGRLDQTLKAPDPNELMMTVVYAPNSSRVAAAGFRGGQVAVWRLSDGALLYTFDGPDTAHRRGNGDAYYRCLAWSPDGEVLAYAGADGAVYLLDARDGTLLRKLFGHTLWVTGVAWAPDGRRLASVSLDGTIRIWGLPYHLQREFSP